MKCLRAWLPIVLLVGLSPAVRAIEECEALARDPGKLAGELSELAVRRAPVEHHPMALEIKLVVRDMGSTLIPFSVEQQGARIVAVPAAFPEAMCKIALAEFLNIEGLQPGAVDSAAQRAARCFENGGSQGKCLGGFADELGRRYRDDFASLPDNVKRTAYNIYRSTLNQVITHEYAHHYLDHIDRIDRNQLKRIDAEFEADLFAILNGVQAAEPPSAMHYLFSGIAGVESHTRGLATPDYESAGCRVKNVENITGFVGVTPMLLLDAAYGGGYVLGQSTPELVRSAVNEELGGPPPTLEEGSCGRITGVALSELRSELKQLYARMEGDLDGLLGQGGQLTVPQARRFIVDVSGLAGGFDYMDGVAMKSVALMLRKWGLAGREHTPLMDQTARILDSQTTTGNFLAEDYGRLLQAQGLAILQERADMPRQARLDRALDLLQRAVHYNPAQSEAWANLAFVALESGDCAGAERYANNSLRTSAEGQDDEGLRYFMRSMGDLADNPPGCAEAAAGFAPYPGL